MIWDANFAWLSGRRRPTAPTAFSSVVLEQIDSAGLHLHLQITPQAHAALVALVAANGDLPGEWRGLLTDKAPPTSSPATASDEESWPDTEAIEEEGYEILADTDDRPKLHRFLVDAPFLVESARFILSMGGASQVVIPPAAGNGLVRRRDNFKEFFHYAAGLRADEQTFVINRIIRVEFANQSVTGVKVEPSSNILALAKLDDVGLPLVSHFHSHPGCGAHITYPSSTDRRFQDTLERGGHVAIGGIFSRPDAAGIVYLRFFAGDPDRFEIEVQGNHVEQIEKHLFRLSFDDGRVLVPDNRK